jgi:TonB-dependent starch-binding outer membrane protein SusC
MTQLFHFKSFELFTLFTYKFGDRFIRPTIDDYVNFPYDRNANKDIAKRWEQPGDELKTDVPAVDPNHPALFRYRSSDLFVENGGYVRWKELTLSYHIPGSVFKSAAIKGLNFSISGQNLAIWTVNKAGIDPDYIPNNSGLLPPSKSFIFSVKADF